MDRRKALKNIGLGAGFLVATPTILSLLQSCKSEPEFIPNFLSKGEGHALRRIVDLIIPSDETVPGAVDVGVHEFIDNFWNEVVPEESQAQVRMAFTGLAGEFTKTFTKDISEGNAEDFDQLLGKYLVTSEEEQKGYNERIGQFYQAYQKDPTSTMDTDLACNQLFGQLRGMTIWGWKASEEIGENVLAYEPIPGQQIGCLSVEEATGGKAYSL
jgi:hypothetical protein